MLGLGEYIKGGKQKSSTPKSMYNLYQTTQLIPYYEWAKQTQIYFQIIERILLELLTLGDADNAVLAKLVAWRNHVCFKELKEKLVSTTK